MGDTIFRLDFLRYFFYLKSFHQWTHYSYFIFVAQDDERKAYYEAFSAFDWNNNGNISYKSLIFAMRRAGANPTEMEVHDIINRLDNGSGVLSFDDFLKVC